IVSNLEIHILEDPEAEIVSSDQTICEGDTASIIFTGTPGAQIRYNDGSGNTEVILNSSGNYPLNVSPTVTTTYRLNRVRYPDNAYPGGNNNCEITLNESITITVNEPATITAPNDITICEGATISLATTTYSGTNSVITWNTSGTGGFSGNIYTPSAADIFNGSVTLTATNTPSDGICGAVSDSMEVTIYEAPSITTQPQSVNVCEGEDVTLSVVAQGDNLSYQWYENGNPTGTNTSSLTLTNLTANGTYYVAITGAAACGGAITSNTITVTVHELSITDQPISQTVCQGQSVTFLSTVSGANGYQWYFNGNPIAGAYGSSYTINSVTAGNAGSYSLQATGTYCPSVTSSTATL